MMTNDRQDVILSPNFSAIFIGALVCLTIQILLASLGSALGLSSLQLEEGDLPGKAMTVGAGIFIFLSIFLSFFFGGMITSKLARQGRRPQTSYHGLGMWALVCVSLAFFISKYLTMGLGNLLTNAGIGAGAAKGVDTVLEQISEFNPRIVTDLQLLKGKAVSQVVIDSPGEDLGKQMAKDVKSDLQSMLAQGQKALDKDTGAGQGLAEEVVEKSRKTAATASWLAVLALIISGVAAVAGSLLGDRRAGESDQAAH